MRTRIDYGIDLGTTNSAIARMQDGKAIIIKTDFQSDVLPSCVQYNKKQAVIVGGNAYNALKGERIKALKNFEEDGANAFIEFKRTMGTDAIYSSPYMQKSYHSEDLSAEVLKKLKSLVTDENIEAVVITVPAKFTVNQKDATVRAGKLSGFKHIELLQEPIAASMAYGLQSKNKDGFWLVFDFGGGTFDAALLKVEEGIMKVIDTEGDNYLGGKDLDNAIVDEIILPYLQANFSVDSILHNPTKKELLRAAMKYYYAEDAKIQLSFKNTVNILSDPGDLIDDDNGVELELDIDVSQKDLEPLYAPIFQRAIDLCKSLLQRNNLSGSNLASLILVGGPTHSPILREMLRQQITDKVDTSCDPMTAVAKGAALYASTLNISDDIIEQSRDRTKIQLAIGNEPTSVELNEFVTIKILKDKTTGNIPPKVYAEITRGDNAWSSGKQQVNEKGEIFDVLLNTDSSNIFRVTLYDEMGNSLDCQPNQFTILQGIKEAETTLAHQWGIEVFDDFVKKDVFIPIKNLKKNQKLPAIGVTEQPLRTQKQIRPGIGEDYFIIPLYQGGYDAEGIKAIYNDHVYDIRISGENLPALLPANSDVELTVKLDRSEQINVSVFFPYLNFTEEIKVDKEKRVKSLDAKTIKMQIAGAKKALANAKTSSNSTAIDEISVKLTNLERQLEQGQVDEDRKFQVLNNLRTEMRSIDEIENEAEWPKLVSELKSEYYDLENLIKKVKELGDDDNIDIGKVEQHMSEIKSQIEEAIRTKDKKATKELIGNISSLDFALRDTLAGVHMDIKLLKELDEEFSDVNWKNASKARELINKGLQMASNNPSKQALRQLIIQILDLLPENDSSSDRLKRGR